MSPEPDDLQILISKYRTMDIEELKSNIDNWDKKMKALFNSKTLILQKTNWNLDAKRGKNK